jgi:hypothetical protein
MILESPGTRRVIFCVGVARDLHVFMLCESHRSG